MDLNKYERHILTLYYKYILILYRQYIITLPADLLLWELFDTNGSINYYLLYSAITSPQKELKWKNSKSLGL